jgi:thioesterase domain-containing protein
VVPAADGHSLIYAELARALGSDQPVHVLQPVGFEGDHKPLERIEEIAEHFLTEVRKVQPRGPYRLVGFCVGGMIAFEMAQRLVAAGEEPPLLAMVETWHPRSVPALRSAPAALQPLNFFFQGLARHLGALRKLPPGEALRYFRDHSAIIWEMILRRDVYRGNRYKRYASLVSEANNRAGSRYIPTPYAGRILLFVAGNRNVDAAWDTRLSWRELALEGYEVFRTDTRDFLGLLKKPHVKTFVGQLNEQLRQFSNVPARASSLSGLVS